MSTCAHVFVLFDAVLSESRAAKIAEIISNRTGSPVKSTTEVCGRLMPVEDADLRADLHSDGALGYNWRGRVSPLIGAPSLQGRLFEISYLTRFWDTTYPEGPAMNYALTMLALLVHPEVAQVWYTNDWMVGNSDGGILLSPIDKAGVHRMIDEFVAIGAVSNGKPTQYIRSENGTVINA